MRIGRRTGRGTGLGTGAAAVVALLLLASGCGSGGGNGAGAMPSGTHTMPDGTMMNDSQMGHRSDSGMTGTDETKPGRSRPSSVAAMICSKEIGGAVRRSFRLTTTPTGSAAWHSSSRRYECRYPLGHSLVTLTVKDLIDRSAGRGWFEGRRAAAHGSTIRGMESLGFPAFESARGEVGFLKDGKTLLVDATSVARADLRPGMGREEAAYGVAAAVLACWSE